MNTILLSGVGVISPSGVGVSFVPKPEGILDWGHQILPDLDPADYGWRGLHRLSRVGKYSALAIGEAIRSAGWTLPIDTPDRSERTGLIVSTFHANLEPIMALYQEAETYGANHVNPGIFPDTVLNAIGGHASIYHRIKGPNVTLSNGDHAFTMSILYAHDWIASGQADQVICCAIHVHPPYKFRAVAQSERGPEFIVALLFQRQDDSVTPMSANRAVQMRWYGPKHDKPSDMPFIPAKHTFLALSTLFNGNEMRCSSLFPRFATGMSDGFYTCELTRAADSGDGCA